MTIVHFKRGFSVESLRFNANLRAVLAYGDCNLLVIVGIVRFAGATAKFDRMCYDGIVSCLGFTLKANHSNWQFSLIT